MMPAARAPEAARGPIQSWVRFWFSPVDPLGLHVVRFLAGLLFLTWLLFLGGQLESLFGLHGWVDATALAELARPEYGMGPAIGWSVLYLFKSNPDWMQAVYWGSLAILALFTLGVLPRLTAVLSWVAIISFTANPTILGDADVFLVILAFYLMVGYVLMGQRDPALPWLNRLVGPLWLRRGTPVPGGAPPRPSLGANVALRLLQVHFALVMVTMGLHKLQFGAWWSGLALWYPLHPPFESTLAEIQALTDRQGMFLQMSVATYAILAWQIGFPFFAWRQRWWRPVLLGGAAIFWLGAALLFKIPLLGPAIGVCCLSYVTAEEWHALVSFLARLPGLAVLENWLLSSEMEQPADIKKEEAPALVPVGQRG
jgi:hypothetical protein